MAVGGSDEGEIVCGGDAVGMAANEPWPFGASPSALLAAAHDYSFARAAHRHAKDTVQLHVPTGKLVGLCLPAASLFVRARAAYEILLILGS